MQNTISCLSKAEWAPLVSIIITHRNYSTHLEGAVLSVLEQTHANWELVIVDDCSDEIHLQRAREIVSKYSGRIHLRALDRNVGQTMAFFAGLDETTGEFVCLLDPDDRYTPAFLLEALKAHLNPVVMVPLICTDQMLVRADPPQVISGTNTNHKLRRLSRNVIELNMQWEYLYFPPSDAGWLWTSTSSMMFRRPALNLMKPHKEVAYKISADAYLAQGAQRLGGSIFCTEPLVYRTVHSDNAHMTSDVFATRQMVKKRSAVDVAKESLNDVLEAIQANGWDGAHLNRNVKKSFWQRKWNSVTKRVPGLRGVG